MRANRVNSIHPPPANLWRGLSGTRADTTATMLLRLPLQLARSQMKNQSGIGPLGERLLTLRAAWMKDQGVTHKREASMAKLEGSRCANFCAKEAVQIHGGAGYTRDFPVERYFRDAPITEIYEGTTEIQKLVIGRSYLKD